MSGGGWGGGLLCVLQINEQLSGVKPEPSIPALFHAVCVFVDGAADSSRCTGIRLTSVHISAVV